MQKNKKLRSLFIVDKLRLLLEHKKVTPTKYADFAREIGISPGTIYLLFKKKSAIPKLETVAAILEQLRTPWVYLDCKTLDDCQLFLTAIDEGQAPWVISELKELNLPAKSANAITTIITQLAQQAEQTKKLTADFERVDTR